LRGVLEICGLILQEELITCKTTLEAWWL